MPAVHGRLLGLSLCRKLTTCQPHSACSQMDPLRRLLVDAGSSKDGAALFSTLYDTWCHSAGAVISLCLMSQVPSYSAPHGWLCELPGGSSHL